MTVDLFKKGDEEITCIELNLGGKKKKSLKFLEQERRMKSREGQQNEKGCGQGMV